MAYFVTKLIPGEDEVVKYEPLYLDEHLIKQAPSIALGNAKKNSFTWEIMLLKPLTFHTTTSLTSMKRLLKKGHKTEEAINTIDEKLTRYLITLSSEALSQKESEVLTNIP